MSAVIGEQQVRLSIHFDGPITVNHHLTVRAMARTYEHMQRAIDRAYLAEKYGAVWKHARLKGEDYEQADFIAAYPREGGIFLDAVKAAGQMPGAVIDRISQAVAAPFDRAAGRGLNEASTMSAQIAARRQYARDIGRSQIVSLSELVENPPSEWARAYSDRSILKEIDQITAQIIPDEVGDSTVDIALWGAQSRRVLSFTPDIARRFHEYVSERQLGPPVTVDAQLRDLDRGNRYTKPKAKIRNLASGKEAVLHLNGLGDFHELHPFQKRGQVHLSL